MTLKQSELVAFIAAYSETHGYPPTYREMAAGIKISGLGALNGMIVSLIEQGELLHNGTRARTVSVPDRSPTVARATTAQLIAEIERRNTWGAA